MSRPLLVLVTGAPATGKSTVARELAVELGIPFVSKDELKERLYEVFGSGDNLEPPVERAALAILFSVAASELDAGVSVLLESNFDAEFDLAPVSRLVEERDVCLVQIHCGGDHDAIARAFAERAASGRRHPGHDDEPADANEVRRKLDAGFWDPLDVPGRLIELDAVAGRIDVRALAADVASSV